MKIKQFIDQYLIEYNFLIAFCTVASMYLFSFALHVKYPTQLYVFGFTSTLATYNLFRAFHSFEHFLKAFKTFRFYLIVIGFSVASMMLIQFHWTLIVGFAILALLTFFYKFELIPNLHLRALPLLKLPIIVFVWVFSCALYALLFPHEQMALGAVCSLVLSQVLFYFGITIPFDVFGLMEDKVVTVPALIGEKNALKLAKFCLVFYAIIPFYGNVDKNLIFSSLITAIYTISVIHFSSRIEQKTTQYYLLDGAIIVQTIVFYVFSGL